MPDLEERIRDTLDRMGERADPARVLEQVGSRRRHLRVVRRVQTATLVVAVLAGVAGGLYGLSRAFGIGAPAPGSGVDPPPSPSPSLEIAGCLGQTVVVTVASQEGAAGTISTVWQVTNTTLAPCSSFGYPDIEVHTASGWLSIQAHHGGYPIIDDPPQSIVVPSGSSMYFVSYWSDVTTDLPCEEFDVVRVSLPGDPSTAEVATTGCMDPASVDVGPVTATPPT